jgi:hypothetical protein
MAFTAADVVGEFWLGLNVSNASKRGSSNGFIFEVEWYDLCGDAYELWDDGLDFVREERLLVKRVEFVSGGGDCVLTAQSKADIAEALALRALNGTVGGFEAKEMP